MGKTIKMMNEEASRFSPSYSAWLGRPVVLLLTIRGVQVALPCRIVAESVADVRICITSAWEMDLRKELIVTVEEDIAPVDGWMN